MRLRYTRDLTVQVTSSKPDPLDQDICCALHNVGAIGKLPSEGVDTGIDSRATRNGIGLGWECPQPRRVMRSDIGSARIHVRCCVADHHEHNDNMSAATTDSIAPTHQALRQQSAEHTDRVASLMIWRFRSGCGDHTSSRAVGAQHLDTIQRRSRHGAK